MLDWFRPVVGNYSIDVKCSNHLCNRSVIVPAQLGVKAMVYCDECRNAMQANPVNEKKHYKWSWKLGKAVRV